MIVKVNIDTDDIFSYTSRAEDETIARDFIKRATDDDLIDEIISRGIACDVIEALDGNSRADLFDYFGYVPADD